MPNASARRGLCAVVLSLALAALLPPCAQAESQGAATIPRRTKVLTGPPVAEREQPADQSEAAEPIRLAVAAGDWGSAAPGEIGIVLMSAARVLAAAVDARERAQVPLRVVPRAGAPRVLYERSGEGYYVVQLTARDVHWTQFAYQFSHELCHIYSNFDHKDLVGASPDTRNQWFEESLCEAAALHTLKAMSRDWARHPPNRNLSGYAPAFEAYAGRLSADAHRQLPDGVNFGTWFEQNFEQLRANPYLRDKNELIANQMLVLFDRYPQLWRTIVYLNRDKASAAKPFADYLRDWYGACPDWLRPPVAEVIGLFGISPRPPEAAGGGS
ncbi:MAG: hypothetical protein KF778_22230 [Rhodocyclaceae bacterium]|nr:hypothetical protein [Rhodocyclaceae bacterium]MBX3671124.1 hypothetical protein [Rhodocyclaceae bacterium]